MAEELDRHEAYLQSERDSTETIATAVLNSLSDPKRAPGLGMAVIEVNPGGLMLRIAAELPQGTHHVYLLGEPVACGSVDARRRHLVGSPRSGAQGYLGALEAVKDGPARFDREIADGFSTWEQVLGHPLVLVHAKGESVVCGEFRERGSEREEEVVTRR